MFNDGIRCSGHRAKQDQCSYTRQLAIASNAMAGAEPLSRLFSVESAWPCASSGGDR